MASSSHMHAPHNPKISAPPAAFPSTTRLRLQRRLLSRGPVAGCQGSRLRQGLHPSTYVTGLGGLRRCGSARIALPRTALFNKSHTFTFLQYPVEGAPAVLEVVVLGPPTAASCWQVRPRQ